MIRLGYTTGVRVIWKVEFSAALILPDLEICLMMTWANEGANDGEMVPDLVQVVDKVS